jgi:Predicted membrane protein
MESCEFNPRHDGLLSIFLFGIEELATQLEEPFTILPMQGFCDKIYNWCMEIVSFKPGDNGMPVYYYDNYNIDALNGSVGGGSLTVEATPESVVETEEEVQDDSTMAIVTDEVEVAEPEVEISIAEPETSSMVNGDAEKVDEPEKKKKRSAVRRVFGNFFGQ